MAEICIETICVDQICFDPVIQGDCVIGCSANVQVVEDSGGVIGCSAQVTVENDESLCKCVATRTLISGDPFCPPVGSSILYQITGCNCTTPSCCGSAGWRWVAKPPWATDATVCLENSILTIGPIKAAGKLEVELECTECVDDDGCPVCEECEDCPDELTASQLAQIKVQAATCITETLTAATALKNGTTVNLSGASANIDGLGDNQNSQVDTAVTDTVVDTIIRGADK